MQKLILSQILKTFYFRAGSEFIPNAIQSKMRYLFRNSGKPSSGLPFTFGKWKMEGETRIIGGYKCYKATAIRPASKTDLRNFRSRPEGNEAKKPADAVAKPADAAKKTNFMDEMNIPKEVVVTAWYTPEVPVNQGPENYWGLPGLILEINDGKTVILCSKIVLNPKEKAEIKASTKGKVVTQSEYDEIMIKKMEEFIKLKMRVRKKMN